MLPSNWNGITVEQYNEINEAPTAKEGLLSFMVFALAVLLDKEIEEVEELTPQEIAEEFKKIRFILKEPEPEKGFNKIGEFTLKPFNKLTFGEAIDGFEILKREENVIEKMAALMFRKTALDQFGNIIFEGRNYDFNERIDFFQTVSVGKACLALHEFKEGNRMIRERYNELFDEPETEEEDEEDEEETEDFEDIERESISTARQKAIEEARKKHGWLMVALDLAKGDATKLEDVFKMSFGYVLNIISIQHETKQ